MNKNSMLQMFLYVWERDYRSFMQGVRSCFALLIVFFIFYFYRDYDLIFLGISVLSLSQSAVRSQYWRFEFNLFLAFFISTVAILISYPYSKSFILICVFIFIITFLIYIFLYYKIDSLFSIWIYIIPMYTVFSLKNFNEALKFVLLNIAAFAICFLICTVILRPRLQKECLFEIKSILRELTFYIDAVEKYTFHKYDKSTKQLTKRRERIFSRIQSLRLMINEINFYRKKQKIYHKNYLFSIYIASVLTERFIEATVAISLKIRTLNVPLEYEFVVRSIFNLMHKTNNDLIKFLTTRKQFTVQDLSFLYEKIYLDALVEFKKIEKFGEEYAFDKTFEEIYSSVYQLKDNISLLNSEFKFLCQKE